MQADQPFFKLKFPLNALAEFHSRFNYNRQHTMDQKQNSEIPVLKRLPDGSLALLSSRGCLIDVPRGLSVYSLYMEEDVVLDSGKTLEWSPETEKEKKRSKKHRKQEKLDKEARQEMEKEKKHVHSEMPSIAQIPPVEQFTFPLDSIIVRMNLVRSSLDAAPSTEEKQQLKVDLRKNVGKFINGMNTWVRTVLLDRLGEYDQE